MEPEFKTRLAECGVGIVGLGLMGGSMALALKGACRSISGYDIDPDTVAQALEHGIIDRPIDLRRDEADLLILAAPVSAILNWIDRVPAIFSGAAHLLDLGSTKMQIVERMHLLPERMSPLGGHPMCGKESSGLSRADGDLYRDCLFVLTPLERTRPATLSIAQELVSVLRARSLILNPQQHDRAAAAISHLPYLFAVTLMDTVSRDADEVTWSMAASGFRDTSRLAASDATMMLDIIQSNHAEVLKVLGDAQTVWQELLELIEREDWTAVRARLELARARRKWWDGVNRQA